MIRLFSVIWTFLFALLVLIAALKAGCQEMKIDLELVGNKKNRIYKIDENEKIFINMKVLSAYAQPVYINEDFSSTNLRYKTRIIDPTGRLVFPGSDKHQNHHHNFQHLSYGVFDVDPADSNPGFTVRFAPCKPFKREHYNVKYNIREIFNLNQPGFYSAQVKTSAMIFENGTCNVDAAPKIGLLKPWIGLLKSNILTFCVAGHTEVINDNYYFPSATIRIPVFLIS